MYPIAEFKIYCRRKGSVLTVFVIALQFHSVQRAGSRVSPFCSREREYTSLYARGTSLPHSSPMWYQAESDGHTAKTNTVKFVLQRLDWDQAMRWYLAVSNWWTCKPGKHTSHSEGGNFEKQLMFCFVSIRRKAWVTSTSSWRVPMSINTPNFPNLPRPWVWTRPRRLRIAYARHLQEGC